MSKQKHVPARINTASPAVAQRLTFSTSDLRKLGGEGLDRSFAGGNSTGRIVAATTSLGGGNESEGGCAWGAGAAGEPEDSVHEREPEKPLREQDPPDGGQHVP